MAELLIDGGEGGCEVVGVLLAECVEMEAGEPRQVGTFELIGGNAESRTGDAGVVARGFAGGVLGIDAQAAVEFAGLESRVGDDGFT